MTSTEPTNDATAGANPPATRDAFVATGIAVADLDRALRFYTEAIGMRQLQTFTLPHLEEIVVGFGTSRGGSVVLMHHTDGVERPRNDDGGKLVFTVEDPAAITERVAAAGGEVTQQPKAFPELGGTVLAFVKDPDGHTIELLQLPPRRSG